MAVLTCLKIFHVVKFTGTLYYLKKCGYFSANNKIIKNNTPIQLIATLSSRGGFTAFKKIILIFRKSGTIYFVIKMF